MTCIRHTEYSFKIPVKIKANICKILKSLTLGIKFEELSCLFEKVYNHKLELFFTANNEIIIETNYDDKYAVGVESKQMLLKNESLNKYSKKEVEEFKNYLSKIDFTFELSKKTNKILSYDWSIYASNYFEIKLKLPCPGKSSEDPEIKKTFARKFELQSLFNHWDLKVDDMIPVFIVNVYDPSKFWIRFFSIDVFERDICDFYKSKKKILSVEISDISIGLNCVALVKNLYCRAKIVRKDLESPNTLKIFLYDYGMLSKVQISQIYYLDESFSEIPAFAMRAMLTNISSLDHQMWTQNVVNRFVELTSDKPLIARIAHIHAKRKIFEIHLLDSSYQRKRKIPTINYRLVYDGLAKHSYQPLNGKKEEKRQCKPLKELLYLYPSFEMIENGLAPSQLYLTEQLKQFLPLDVIFPEFYEYEDQNEI